MGLETLVWQPSRATLRVAALFDLFLLVWVVAMLLSYWIVVEYDNCEMNGVPVKTRRGSGSSSRPFAATIRGPVPCADPAPSEHM